MEMEYDVIIVGTGVAGCYAALNLPKQKRILMITKASLEESDSFLAQGGICVLKSEDDYDSFFEDTLKAGHYENRKESVDIMIRSSRSVIEDLIRYGVEFAMEDGELVFTREAAHSTNRILYHEDITGKEITTKLLAQVKKLENVTILTETTMVDILCRDNCCDGVILKTKDGELTPVFAHDVLWACGGIGGVYKNSTNFPHLTGDALAISIRHGIGLEHVNYVQIHPTTLYSKKKGRRFLISESVRGEGAVLYNKNGERFVDELLPRDLLTNEIHKQMQKDNMPYVMLSMNTIKNCDIKQRFPNIYQYCLEEGYDVTKESIPVVPSQHYFMGGVYVDSVSKTTMNHLYAAGETSCNGVHGANRLASNSLLESLVFAKRAVLDMVEHWEERKQPIVVESAAELLKQYGIDMDLYRNSEQYEEDNKQLVLKAIEKENRKGVINESNNNTAERR